MTIAIDVSVREDLLIDENIHLNNWDLLKYKLNPFIRSPKHPNIIVILTRASIIGSIAQQNKVKNIADLYLQLPVNHFPLMAYKQGADIAGIGYEYAMEILPEWWQKTILKE